MRILFVLAVFVFALFLGACADQSLIADEDYNAMHPAAPYAPDPMAHIPQQSTRPGGF